MDFINPITVQYNRNRSDTVSAAATHPPLDYIRAVNECCKGVAGELILLPAVWMVGWHGSLGGR